MSSITHTLLDVNHREWKNPNDTWCVTCALVCLFFVRPGTWVALEYLIFTSIVIRFNNSSTHIFVRQCRNSSKNNNKFFCHIGCMHIRSGAPKSSPLGCKTSLANSLRSSLWSSEKEAFMSQNQLQTKAMDSTRSASDPPCWLLTAKWHQCSMGESEGIWTWKP